MKRTSIVVSIGIMLAVLVVVGVPDIAAAATATSPLSVTATVVASCNVTGTTAVAFGNYDPANATDNDAGQGSMTFRCTKGTAYMLFISGARTMTGAPTPDSLNYELYTDAPRTALFPSAAGALSMTSANNAPVTIQIYGRITALQDVSVGSYTSTVTASVEY